MTATGSTAEPPEAQAFYDARRDVYYTKPAWRGWLHLLWFEVSLVFSTLLLARADGATRIAASAIYAASVCGDVRYQRQTEQYASLPPCLRRCHDPVVIGRAHIRGRGKAIVLTLRGRWRAYLAERGNGTEAEAAVVWEAHGEQT